jgi:uncharacterized protein DUF5666
MLTKLITLARGKVALAVLGVVLVGGGGAAIAFAATHSAHAGQDSSSAPNDNNGKSADTNHGHTVSLEGVLKAYNAGAHSISVLEAGAKAATSVTVNASTRVNGEHASSLADLAKNIGHKVEVSATKQSDGSLLASKVTVQGADSDEVDGSASDDHSGQNSQHEAEGKIASVGSGSFVLTLGNGTKMTVVVNSATKFGGTIHAFAGLKQGLPVNVRGTPQSNGSLLATEIDGEGDH